MYIPTLYFNQRGSRCGKHMNLFNYLMEIFIFLKFIKSIGYFFIKLQDIKFILL